MVVGTFKAVVTRLVRTLMVRAQNIAPLQATNVNEYLWWDGDKKIDALASISNKP